MLFFLHMPKTGGHSFKQAIFKRYGMDRVRFVNSLADWESFLAEYEPGRWDCVHGHMPCGLGEMLPEPAVYYVVLRNPLDRFVSAYYHIRTKTAHPAHAWLNSENITLRQFAQAGRDCDAQVKRLLDYDYPTMQRRGG
ncbi:MAG: sulfotransferase family protein, partial [Planctomycetales bacterium]